MSNDNVELSIIVPCYNEAGNIPLIVQRFDEITQSEQNIEIILVNNGSTDNSKEIFEEQLRDKGVKFKVANVTKNQGYGYGILSGLQEATGNVLAWTHADMQTDPQDVLIAYKKYQEANNTNVFVKGKRKNRRLAEAFFTWGMQIFASLTLKTPLNDINAQPKLFHRSFYETYLVNKAPLDFSLDLYALYCAVKHSQIIQIPVYFEKRMHGEAKGGGSFKTRIKLIKRTFKYIFELRQTLKNTPKVVS